MNYVGPVSAFLLTGSFVVESIFTIPGLGREFVSSITNRDYTLILGLTVFMGTVVILVNLVTDLVCTWMDPRMRRGIQREIGTQEMEVIGNVITRTWIAERRRDL